MYDAAVRTVMWFMSKYIVQKGSVRRIKCYVTQSIYKWDLPGDNLQYILYNLLTKILILKFTAYDENPNLHVHKLFLTGCKESFAVQ